jgi:transposase
MRRYFGVDLHKTFVVVAGVEAKQTIVYPAEQIALSQLAGWAAEHLTQQDEVAVEATTNAWHVHDVLSRHAGRVLVANPAKTALIAQSQVKSDRVDAEILAWLLAAQFLYTVWVPDPSVRQQRTLVAHQADPRHLMTQTKNRVHALLRRHDLRCPVGSLFTAAGREWLEQLTLPLTEKLELRHLLQQLDMLAQQMDETDRHIAQLAQRDVRVTRIIQLTGIGYYTAFAILAAVGDVHRFATADRLAAYAGLVPSYHQSDGKAYSGRITKAGPSKLRWLLVEAAHIAVRYDPHWQRVYDAIRKRRGGKVALVAVARKMLVTIWHLLVHHSRYRSLQAQTLVRKMQVWASRIGRHHLPANSSADFVRQQLCLIGLDELARSLTNNKKSGQLLVPQP